MVAEKRVAELAQDERHHTVAETRYWCQQYRTMAEQLERERDEARAEVSRWVQAAASVSEDIPEGWACYTRDVTDERDQLRALLQEVEWVWTSDEDGEECPICHASRGMAHDSNCRLKAALKD